MSAAPSISTPRLPPSLVTFLIFFLRSASSSSGVGSFFASSAGFSSFSLGALSLPFLPSFFGDPSFFGSASFFAAASFLPSFFSSFLLGLGAAASPLHISTLPRTFEISGCAMHKLNHLIRLPRLLRSSGPRTSLKASANTLQTLMSASVIWCPTMYVKLRKCLSNRVRAFIVSFLAFSFNSALACIVPFTINIQVQRGTSSSRVQNSTQESI
mmetsp:Transcript_148742/g.263001  ORF Transcript_148742/g.263001 Transcript_148742/m.263001 type:complete len:213 (-) Transcript_148742:360-998(-)